MSLNIMGGKFNNDHIKFVPKNKASNLWDGKTKIYLSDYVNDIEIEKIYCIIYLNASGIEGTTVPYKVPAKNNKKIIEILYGKEYSQSENMSHVPVQGELRISHKPTNLNYWHTELNLYSLDGKEINRDKAVPKYIKDFCNAVFTDVLNANLFQELTTNLMMIPNTFYIKN
ncbi:hypothetical protein [Arachidicoccus soli]|nr:hypothetical protein [Arachidicoccus soli]